MLHQTELDHARQLLRETPVPGDVNPLAVVQVVNCLHALGKEQAIALLRGIAPEDGRTPVVSDPDHDDGESEELVKFPQPGWDDWRACLIVPLLFEVEPDGTPPPAEWYDKDKQCWSILGRTVVVQDGIPFDMCGHWSLQGWLPATFPLVEWAAAHGKLRKGPLRPTDDPLQAADVLYERVLAGTISEFSAEYWMPGEQGMMAFRDHLRCQAIGMLPQSLQDCRRLSWAEKREYIARAGVHWECKIQAFVRGGEPKSR
ncbi:MAG: hypothetical protein R6U98_03130 [Pirellulaceae bacterium]